MAGSAADGIMCASRKLESRAARIVSMLALLQSGARLNAQSLADAFSVHRRTVFRDLAELRRLGISVGFNESNEGYLVVEDRLPAGELSRDELAALLLAAKMSPLNDVEGVSALLAAAGSKLLVQYPKLRRDDIGSRLAICERDKASLLLLGYDALQDVLDAIHRRCTLNIRLESQDGPRDFEIEPWRLRFADETWWLICRADNPPIAVAIDLRSINALELGKRSFRLPRRLPRKIFHIDSVPPGGNTNNAPRTGT